VNKFLDSAWIAIEAIWSAKLRSFMTVLGNIVAVTSIIAVVSLIQGLNASVKDAIVSQAGADSFNIQQYPVTRSDEDFDKVFAERTAFHFGTKSVRFEKRCESGVKVPQVRQPSCRSSVVKTMDGNV